MSQKKQKKQKKSLVNKNKLKSSINVKINIDNSKKTTSRKTSRRTPSKQAPTAPTKVPTKAPTAPTKAPNLQPFVNFPTFQPVRIQQLEPRQQFNNADFTKTMDEYQKQFKTYLETKDKDTKEMIEKFDDTLKKNIAPPKKEESEPGAANVLTDNEGVEIINIPIPSKQQQQNWSNPNEFKANAMTQISAQPLLPNQLMEELPPNQIEEAQVVTTKDIIENDLESSKKTIKNISKLNKTKEYYNKYLYYYKLLNDDDNYLSFLDDEGDSRFSSQGWSNKARALEKTYDEQKEKERKEKERKEKQGEETDTDIIITKKQIKKIKKP